MRVTRIALGTVPGAHSVSTAVCYGCLPGPHILLRRRQINDRGTQVPPGGELLLRMALYEKIHLALATSLGLHLPRLTVTQTFPQCPLRVCAKATQEV